MKFQKNLNESICINRNKIIISIIILESRISASEQDYILTGAPTQMGSQTPAKSGRKRGKLYIQSHLAHFSIAAERFNILF